MPGCDIPCKDLNTECRNGARTNGRELPVEVSQMRVVSEPGRGTAVSLSEADGRDSHSCTSGSARWASTVAWKSMTLGACNVLVSSWMRERTSTAEL